MPSAPVGRNLLVVGIFSFFLMGQLGGSLALNSEPYPLVRMPGFGDAPDKDGKFPVEIASVSLTYDDGTTIHPHVAEFMNNFRYSSSVYSFNYMFKDNDNAMIDDEVTSWMYDTAKKLHPESKPTYIDVCWFKAEVNIKSAEYENKTACDGQRINL
ncbi:hypothetical protein [Kocuria rosea]|uniref:hypothetical protein n=1 Tax=Kocuria rosea TaxID=1275 RepID=UPI00126A0EBB|nr:hypothetical protein [Kocuria polaris]